MKLSIINSLDTSSVVRHLRGKTDLSAKDLSEIVYAYVMLMCISYHSDDKETIKSDLQVTISRIDTIGQPSRTDDAFTGILHLLSMAMSVSDSKTAVEVNGTLVNEFCNLILKDELTDTKINSLLLKFETSLSINCPLLKSAKRVVSYWKDSDVEYQQKTIDTITRKLFGDSRITVSENISEKFADAPLIDGLVRYNLMETTSAGNIATSVGVLGMDSSPLTMDETHPFFKRAKLIRR